MPIALLQHISKKTFNRIATEYKKPGNAVSELIESFWMVPATFFQTPSIGFNDGVPTICVFAENQDLITAEHNGQLTTVKTAWLSSPYLKGVQLHTATRSELLVIRFHRNSFYKTFDIQPDMLRDRPIWNLQVLGEIGEIIINALSGKLSINSKITAFEAIIARHENKTEVNYIVEEGIAMIEKTKGRICVNQLVDNLGVNYKWLERNFTKNLGISPKEYIIQQRFIHAYSFCIENPKSDLLGIAVENGYYDQSHLIKDFKRFCGKAFSVGLAMREGL